MTQRSADEIKAAVLDRYGGRARKQLEKQETIELTAKGGGDSCCGAEETLAEETSNWAEKLYSAQELGKLPDEVTEMSLGCGNPTAIAEVRVGESVLDLGSGSGLDCFLVAQQVGAEGRVVGLDMSDDMLALARRNLVKVGATNVEFHKGELESMPLPDDTFDVIISNCVINLSPDKDAVLRESHRVLKPGGRVRVSDIVWTRKPTEEEQSNLDSWAGCVAGALEVSEYAAKLRNAGFESIDVKLAGRGRGHAAGPAPTSARRSRRSQAAARETVTTINGKCRGALVRPAAFSVRMAGVFPRALRGGDRHRTSLSAALNSGKFSSWGSPGFRPWKPRWMVQMTARWHPSAQEHVGPQRSMSSHGGWCHRLRHLARLISGERPLTKSPPLARDRWRALHGERWLGVNAVELKY